MPILLIAGGVLAALWATGILKQMATLLKWVALAAAVVLAGLVLTGKAKLAS